MTGLTKRARGSVLTKSAPLRLARFPYIYIYGKELACARRAFIQMTGRMPICFLKPFLKGKILRSSERGVNSILTTILRF